MIPIRGAEVAYLVKNLSLTDEGLAALCHVEELGATLVFGGRIHQQRVLRLLSYLIQERDLVLSEIINQKQLAK